MRIGLVLVAAVSLLFAVAPSFRGPFPVYDGNTPIDVGNYGTPCLGDLNQDGNKDLVIGQLAGGYVRFYPNVGQDSHPVFNGFSYLSASGAQISLPSG